MLLHLFLIVFSVFPIDSQFSKDEVEISHEKIEFIEYVTEEIRNFTEFCTSLQSEQSQRIEKLYKQNEIASLKYVVKRIELLNESVASVERKQICKNSTYQQFSWALLRFPLEFELNCSPSVNRVYSNNFDSNDFTYLEHISWFGEEIKNSYNSIYQNCRKIKEEINFSECLFQGGKNMETLTEFLHEKINKRMNSKIFDLEEFDRKFPLCYEEMKNQLNVNYQRIERQYLDCLTEMNNLKLPP